MLQISQITKFIIGLALGICISLDAQADSTHGAIPDNQSSFFRLMNTNTPSVQFQYMALTPDPTVTGPLTMQLGRGVMTYGVRENTTSEPGFGTTFFDPQVNSGFFGYGFGAWPLFHPFVSAQFQADYGCDATANTQYGFIHDLTFIDGNQQLQILGTIIDCTNAGGKIEFRFNPANGLNPPYNSGRFELVPTTLEAALDDLTK